MQRIESFGKSVRRSTRQARRCLSNIHGFFNSQNNPAPAPYNNALQNQAAPVQSKLEDNYLTISNSDNDFRNNVLNDAYVLQKAIQKFHLETLLGIEKLIIEHEPTSAVGQLRSHAVFLEANREEVVNLSHVLRELTVSNDDADLLLSKCYSRLLAIKQECESEHGLYENLYLNDNTNSGFDNWSHAESETASENDSQSEKPSRSK